MMTSPVALLRRATLAIVPVMRLPRAVYWWAVYWWAVYRRVLGRRYFAPQTGIRMNRAGQRMRGCNFWHSAQVRGMLTTGIQSRYVSVDVITRNRG